MDTFDGKYPSKGFMKAILLTAGLGIAFVTGTGAGVLISASPPALSELESCAMWNKSQVGITSDRYIVPLGFDVQRNGKTLHVSCTRREAATRESFWGHP